MFLNQQKGKTTAHSAYVLAKTRLPFILKKLAYKSDSIHRTK